MGPGSAEPYRKIGRQELRQRKTADIQKGWRQLNRRAGNGPIEENANNVLAGGQVLGPCLPPFYCADLIRSSIIAPIGRPDLAASSFSFV